MSREIKRTDIAVKIRKRRKELHLTQFEIAEMLGIKRNTYARYETDTIPPIPLLSKIGDLLGLTSDELLRNDVSYLPHHTNSEPFMQLKNRTTYNAQNNDEQFTDDEITTLIKIINLSPEKREQLINYIANVVEDENLL